MIVKLSDLDILITLHKSKFKFISTSVNRLVTQDGADVREFLKSKGFKEVYGEYKNNKFQVTYFKKGKVGVTCSVAPSVENLIGESYRRICRLSFVNPTASPDRKVLLYELRELASKVYPPTNLMENLKIK